MTAPRSCKGHAPKEGGAMLSPAGFEARSTGYAPQILDEISDFEARELGADWLVQEKHDGERRGVRWTGARAVFANRRGLEVSVDAGVAGAVDRLGRMVGTPFSLDAEDMGDHLVIFDVLEHAMLHDNTFRERATALESLRDTISGLGLGVYLKVEIPMPASVFFSDHAERLKAGGAEGYVIRHAGSRYAPGLPETGGDAFKVRHWAEATCRVSAGGCGNASVGLELQDGADGPWVLVGNMSLSKKKLRPAAGALVDVRYLHASRDGSLVQPVLKRIRGDLTPAAARLSQLKYHRGPALPDTSPDALSI